MIINCELTPQRGNPQVPIQAGECIRTIVQFPIPEGFNDFVDSVKYSSFKVQIGDEQYEATPYNATDKTQSIKINLGDDNIPTLVTFLIDIYGPVSIIPDIINSKVITLII